MRKDLVILGAGGFGREASLLVEEINAARANGGLWNLLGFIDEDETRWGNVLRGYPVLGGWEALYSLPEKVKVICVVADPAVKQKMVNTVAELGRQFATLIHPDVSLAPDVQVGVGVLINIGSILTINIKLGDHVSINPGCGIGHDVEIGAYTTLMWRVNLAGNVNIGKGCLVGSGVTVLQGKIIGDFCTVGAGAIVTTDLPAGCTAKGIPARPNIKD